MIPAKYHATRAVIENQPAAVENCTVTTDLWTSLHSTATCLHFNKNTLVDSDFNHQTKCLQTLEITDANSLKDVLSSIFHDWNITGKLCGGITDNASNMINPFRLLAIDHFHYVAHTLQLSIGRGLDVPRDQQVIGHCKNWSHISRSLPRKHTSYEKSGKCSSYPNTCSYKTMWHVREALWVSLGRCPAQCGVCPKSDLLSASGLRIAKKAQYCFLDGREACGVTGQRLQGAGESSAGWTWTTNVQRMLNHLLCDTCKW